MKVAVVKLKSTAPYSQSRFHNTPKLEKEGGDTYEQRTWIDKGHYTEEGEMFIPPMALKFCLEAAARELGEKITGRGKKTYASAFKNGIIITDPILLGVKKDSVKPNWIYANADGIRGSAKRVLRAFPTIDKWKATATFHIINDSLTEDVFERHLKEAGNFIGLGQFRPHNGGYFGRFEVLSIEWKE